jgi:hypothetical protein
MGKLPKHHDGQIRTTYSCSISLPHELRRPLLELAAFRGMNRSEYIAWLIRMELQRQGLPMHLRLPSRVRQTDTEE